MPILEREEVIEAAGLEAWQAPARRTRHGDFKTGAALASMFATMREQRVEAEVLQQAVLRGRRVAESSQRWWLEASILQADRWGEVNAAEMRARRAESAAARTPLVSEADAYDPNKYRFSPDAEVVKRPQVAMNANRFASVPDAAAALLTACEEGDERSLEHLLRRHDSSSLLRFVQLGTQKSALHLAAQHGHAGVCGRLLEQSANAHAPDQHGRSPLALACVHARPLVVKQLLHAKAHPETWDLMERNALHLACCCSDPDIAVLLLGHSPRLINEPDGRGRTGLWYCLSSVHRSKRQKLMKQLLTQRADANLTDSHGRSPLWYASKAGLTSFVAPLLDHHADPNLRDEDGLSALNVARSFNTSARLDVKADIAENMYQPAVEIISVSIPRVSPSGPMLQQPSAPAIDVTGGWSCDEGTTLITLRQDPSSGAVTGEIASSSPGRPELALYGRVIEDQLIYSTGPSHEQTTFKLHLVEGCRVLKGRWEDFRGCSGRHEMWACQPASPASSAVAE